MYGLGNLFQGPCSRASWANALSAFVDGDAGLRDVLRTQPRLAIPVILLGEFRYGIALSKHRSSYEAWLESHLSRFDVVPDLDRQGW